MATTPPPSPPTPPPTPPTTDSTAEGLVRPKAFVRTYASRSYADPWEAIEDYQRVLEFAAEHPNLGSSAVANRLDLPRGRIRQWMDGSRPDCLRGLQVAEERGWIGVEPDGDTFRGLNALVAWVYSGGSISTPWCAPYLAVRHARDRQLVERAADLAGVTVDETRSGGDGRARELKPVEHASVLGRVMVCLGAPRGEKNERSGVRLPGYLEAEEVPERVSREFVQVYVHNRGQRRADSDVIHFREDRSTGYLRSLAGLIERLAGESVTVSEKNIILSAPAARAVRSWPTLLGLGT